VDIFAYSVHQVAAFHPFWGTQPAPVFTVGVADTYTLNVFSPSGLPLTLTLAPGSASLPGWLMLDSAARQLQADGTQVDADDFTGLRIRATDSLAQVADSDPFPVIVNPAAGGVLIIRDKDPAANVTITPSTTTSDVAEAHATTGVPLGARLVWPLTNAPRVITGVTVQVVLMSGVTYQVNFVADGTAAAAVYDDIEIEWYVA